MPAALVFHALCLKFARLELLPAHSFIHSSSYAPTLVLRTTAHFATGYPWKPKGLAEIMGSGPLINHEGQSLEWSSLAGKFVSFYFSVSTPGSSVPFSHLEGSFVMHDCFILTRSPKSTVARADNRQAHWCGPCRGFTPKLVETYKAARAAGKNWEIIFVSADNEESEFEEYYGEMPWLALPHEDPRTGPLNTLFEVEGIPTLVLLDPSGKVLSTELRGAVEEDPAALEFPWPRKAVESLQGAVGSINEVPTLVFITDGSDAQVAAAKAALQPAADTELARADGGRLRFAVAGASKADQEISKQLLQLSGHAKDPLPVAVLFNVPGGRRYDVQAPELTADGITAVVARFGDKSLQTVPLRA
jgi:nucleoredoxin